MTFFTQDENRSLVEAVSGVMAKRVAGSNLPEKVRAAAVEAGKASVGKGLEERRQLMHHFFNKATVQAQVEDRAFRPTNETVNQFNEVAINSLNQHEAALAAGSFEDVADDPGSPLSAEDRARLNKRKTNEDAESAGSFEDVAKSKGSPLMPDQTALLNKRKVREGAEGAGSFEDVADDPGSPLSAEDRARLNKRKVRESAVETISRLAERGGSFGGKRAEKFDVDDAEKARLIKKKPGSAAAQEAEKNIEKDVLDKQRTGREIEAQYVPEQDDTTGTDKDAEDTEQDERRVSVKAQTVRDIDDVPVSKTHSFVKESWTVLVNTADMTVGEQHLLAGKLAAHDGISEACASCATNRQPFVVTVKAETETEAIENLVSALENVGSRLDAENVLVAHRTPEKGGPAGD